MIPVVGKWYNIEFGTPGSKVAYHGKAKCMCSIIDVWPSCPEKQRGWFYFRKPNQPEDCAKVCYMLFSPKEVKSETTPEPTYEELLSMRNNYEK